MDKNNGMKKLNSIVSIAAGLITIEGSLHAGRAIEYIRKIPHSIEFALLKCAIYLTFQIFLLLLFSFLTFYLWYEGKIGSRRLFCQSMMIALFILYLLLECLLWISYILPLLSIWPHIKID